MQPDGALWLRRISAWRTPQQQQQWIIHYLLVFFSKAISCDGVGEHKRRFRQILGWSIKHVWDDWREGCDATMVQMSRCFVWTDPIEKAKGDVDKGRLLPSLHNAPQTDRWRDTYYLYGIERNGNGRRLQTAFAVCHVSYGHEDNIGAKRQGTKQMNGLRTEWDTIESLLALNECILQSKWTNGCTVQLIDHASYSIRNMHSEICSVLPYQKELKFHSDFHSNHFSGQDLRSPSA